MSNTFDIVCVKCKEKLWVGQGQTLYFREEHTMEKFKEFLFEHQNHPLMFTEANLTYDFIEDGILPEEYGTNKGE